MTEAPASGTADVPGQQDAAPQPDPEDVQLAKDAELAARASHDRAHARELFGELAGLSDDDPQRQRVRDELVEIHLPLVEYLARRFRNRGEPLDDLIQVATIGLIKSVDRFDPEYRPGYDVAELVRLVEGSGYRGKYSIEITNPPADIVRGAQVARDVIAANLAK